jgi:hypothetical protein
MEIRINGKAADITADSEKNVGEVMAGLEDWMANSGHRLSGLAIDGKNMDSFSLEEAFSREISSVKILDIITSSVAELTAQSLLRLYDDINEFEQLDFEKRGAFFEDWKERAEAVFASQQAQDLYLLYVETFNGEGVSCEVLRSITEERLREVNTPAAEFAAIQSLINENCLRLVDISLDIQTGKDGRAAQTIQIFSCLAEKIFRILRQLDIQGFLPQNSDGEKPVSLLAADFSAVVKELLDAYERHDSVLVGDLAEYEIAPRLQELYSTIEKFSCERAANRE